MTRNEISLHSLVSDEEVGDEGQRGEDGVGGGAEGDASEPESKIGMTFC